MNIEIARIAILAAIADNKQDVDVEKRERERKCVKHATLNIEEQKKRITKSPFPEIRLEFMNQQLTLLAGKSLFCLV